MHLGSKILQILMEYPLKILDLVLYGVPAVGGLHGRRLWLALQHLDEVREDRDARFSSKDELAADGLALLELAGVGASCPHDQGGPGLSIGLAAHCVPPDESICFAVGENAAWALAGAERCINGVPDVFA